MVHLAHSYEVEFWLAWFQDNVTRARECFMYLVYGTALRYNWTHSTQPLPDKHHKWLNDCGKGNKARNHISTLACTHTHIWILHCQKTVSWGLILFSGQECEQKGGKKNSFMAVSCEWRTCSWHIVNLFNFCSYLMFMPKIDIFMSINFHEWLFMI